MPIYEYECQKCGKRFEYIQKLSEPPKMNCESCAGKLEKLISPSGFILKGGGWYKDLYSKKPGSSSSDSSSPAPVKDSAKKGSKE
jgi:putative FmdB family regulatory protein